MTDSPLSGKRIVITGAGRGLGRATAIVAAQQGADIVLVGRDSSRLKGVADDIESAASRSSEIVTCDLADAGSVRAACEKILGSGRVVDVLINNGAPWLEGSLSETTDSEISNTVAAAVTGTILITRGLLPGIRRSPAADIVTVVSTAGYLGWDIRGASVAFHAAKHGQSGFSDRLRHELKDEGIRVSAIYPPDFDDLDPLDPRWTGSGETAAVLTNREIVSTVLFVITAPRACNYPVIVIDGMPD